MSPRVAPDTISAVIEYFQHLIFHKPIESFAFPPVALPAASTAYSFSDESLPIHTFAVGGILSAAQMAAASLVASFEYQNSELVVATWPGVVPSDNSTSVVEMLLSFSRTHVVRVVAP